MSRPGLHRGVCDSCGQLRVLHEGVCTACIEGRAVDSEARCFYHRDEYKDYAAAVELVIHRATDAWDAKQSKKPVEERVQFPGLSTREIHDQLGEHARREWTLSVINTTSSLRTVEGVILDRYRRASGEKPLYRGRWNNQSMNFLFPQRRKAAASPVDPPRERALT